VLCSTVEAKSITSLILSDGRKVEIENKTCSSCPDPSIKIIGKDGKIIEQFPGLEKELILSELMVEDKYLVTATTGGEGKIRVYDINKPGKKIIKTIQPFGTPNTWGNLFYLDNSEFIILSNPTNSYTKPSPKFPRAIIYKIINNDVIEIKRIEDIASQRSDMIYKNNKIVFWGGDAINIYTRTGKLIKTLSHSEESFVINALFIDSNDVISILAYKIKAGNKYFIRIDGESASGAMIEAFQKIERENKGRIGGFGARTFFNPNDNTTIDLYGSYKRIDLLGSIKISNIPLKNVPIKTINNTLKFDISIL
jgi:hypothetical protein